MTNPAEEPRRATRASDPVERHEPDLDPGLAPDPEHEVRENPPEGAGPAGPRDGEAAGTD